MNGIYVHFIVYWINWNISSKILHELWKNYSRCFQISKNKSTSHTLTYPHVHAHTHTHKHTHQQHGTFLRGNIFSVSYPDFLFAYEAPVSSSRKFPHKPITVASLQQHDMLCGSKCDIYCSFIVWYIFTPLHFCTHLMCLSPCSPDQSPHTPVESRTVKWPTVTAQHSYDLL